jgi:hypothetical protein
LLAVILPTAPFGLPKYDNGERWDLKAKCAGPQPEPHLAHARSNAWWLMRAPRLRCRYTDEGYEDPDADVMGKFMALFRGKRDKGDK